MDLPEKCFFLGGCVDSEKKNMRIQKMACFPNFEGDISYETLFFEIILSEAYLIFTFTWNPKQPLFNGWKW